MAYGSKFCSKILKLWHMYKHACVHVCTSFVPMGIVTLINPITVCGRMLYCLLLHILIICLSGGTVDLNTLM